MKLFVWQGDGVLTDYTNGMIVALAETLELALEQMKTIDVCVYGSFPALPTEIVDLGECSALPVANAWAVYGGG